jgi:multiple sugar transport system permease protein
MATNTVDRRQVQLFTPTIGKVCAWVAAAIIAIAWLMPMLWALDTSIKPESETLIYPPEWVPSRVTGEAYTAVLSAGEIIKWFVNSTIVSVAVTVMTIFTSAWAAYAFARLPFRGRGFLYALTIAGIMVPGNVLVVPLFQEMLALKMVDTYWGIILPQVAAPVMVYILKKFFEALPRELEDAALVDGANRWRIFWQIVLPLSRPILAVVSIFSIVAAWKDFIWPLLVLQNPEVQTLSVALQRFEPDTPINLMLAGLVIASVPMVVAFLIFQRQILAGLTAGSLKG